MNWRKIAVGLASVGALWYLVWFTILYFSSPETQMLRMHNKFMAAVENKSFWTLDGMVSNDYTDTEHDAANVRSALRQVLGGFESLKITQANIKTKGAKSQGKNWLGFVSESLTLEGKGRGLSPEVIVIANSMKKPWFFHWHKRGFWPWSWELMQVHNDDIGKMGSLDQ